MELEVLSRVALAPRQGVAVVRFERGTALISYGEGGVRLLLEGEEIGDSSKDELPLQGSFAAALDSSDGRRPGPAGSVPGLSWNRIWKVARGMGTSLWVAACLQVGLPGTVSASPLAQTAPAEANIAAGGESTQVEMPTPPPEAAVVLDALSQSFRSMEVTMGEGDDAFRLSGPVGTVVLMGFLTLLPTLVLLMTGFTRILVVLHLLRQALGTQAAPPAHLLAAMALLLTGFVMAPTLGEVNETALSPWMAGEMGETEMLQAAALPFRSFMLEATREQDLQTFLELQSGPRPSTVDEVPTVVVTSAFITSELRNAFQMGFALFLPFVVIDLVVASVLMSMGMFMLPPVMVSLPFKLLLFVLVDGWALIVGGLVRSFQVG